MSHFVVIALLPGKTLPQHIEARVDALLAPYNENESVPEYEQDCWCIGSEARIAGSGAADAKVGTIETLRDSFWAGRGVKARWDLPEEEREIQDAEWRAHLAPWNAVKKEVEEAHPLAGKPKPDCSDCKGTGRNTTEYNPQSKWDWFQIGGRWTGHLSGYDPDTDPRNWEPCTMCGATGKRDDTLGRETREKDPTYTCNVCQGWKIARKFSNAPDPSGDWRLCGSVDWTDKTIPYAIVDPDGEWHERGQMGWFGLSSNDKSRDEWGEQARAIFAKYPDHLAVVVDCHI